ncbi:MAG: DinB family protein [Mucilaginibacter sp.]|uniref:DinB family protein n=1 Tax=Mucilaginibacter sp. TaxID=1882438 RepID=UPI003263978C
MIKALDYIVQPRKKVLEIIKPLSIEQVNHIPTGFNNNIIWNLGHMIAAQQGICYKRAGLDTIVGEEFFDRYKPGSKPEQFFDAIELEKIIGLLSTTITQLEADLKTDMFGNYPAFTTRYGIELTSVDDAVQFLPFHEGLHIGTIVAMSKIV